MSTTVLKGGRVVDPATGTDERADLVVQNGIVTGLDAPYASDAEVIDCTGNLVLPGMIDTHAHVYRYVTGRFGLDADMCGVRSGVTTLVDQGGPSCMTLPGFRHFIAEPAKTRVLAFISAYLVGGLEGHYYPALYQPECLNVDATAKAVDANLDLVKGIKAHAELGGFQRWGMDVIKLAAQIGHQSHMPVYLHFGQLWPSPEDPMDIDPDTIFPNVLELVKPGDVLAHPFTRHPGGFVDKHGKVHDLIRDVLDKGVKIDVGHGSHFSFDVARKVLDAGIVPHTMGADMHGYNTRLAPPPGTPDVHSDPEEGDHMFAGAVRFSLASSMTSLLALGLTLDQVVSMVTTNAAAMLGMQDEIGHLKPGAVADVSVLNDERGQWTLHDNEGHRVNAERMLTPRFCLRAGERFDADAPTLPQFAPAEAASA